TQSRPQLRPKKQTKPEGSDHQRSEKKSMKRKSVPNSDSSPLSKLPKYEEVEVNLQAKTIYMDPSACSTRMERSQLIKMLPNEGDLFCGDYVWAKMQGYPWWPCLITIDPETGNYSKISGKLTLT